MKMESIGIIASFDPYTTHQNGPEHNFGEVVKMADGRWFRYNSAVATNHKGYLQQAPTIVADAQNMTILAAQAVGSFQITATMGTTAAAVGIYDEGYAIVNAGSGLGQTFKVKHSSLVSATAALDPLGVAYGVIIDLFDQVKVALTTTATSSKISLVHNTYNLTQEVASLTGRPAGVPLVVQTLPTAAPTTIFGWLQTRGVAAVYSADGAGTTGLMATSTASGAGGVINYVTGGVNQTLGYFLYTAANSEFRPVMLMIN